MSDSSKISSFDRILKEHFDYWSRPHTPEERARDEAMAKETQAIYDEWDALRAQLNPCRCGAPSSALHFQCAQMGATATVWCTECKLNSPQDRKYDELWVYGESGSDSRPEAIKKWNAYVG